MIEAELEKALSAAGKQITAEERTRDRQLAKIDSDSEVEKVKKTSALIYNMERELIKLLYEGNEEVAEFISMEIPSEEFAIEAHTHLAKIVYDALKNNEELIASSLIEKIQDEKLQAYILELTFEKYPISKNWEDIFPGESSDVIIQKIAKDTVKKFKIEKIDLKIKDNQKQISGEKSEEEKFTLLKLNMELEKEKFTIAQSN